MSRVVNVLVWVTIVLIALVALAVWIEVSEPSREGLLLVAVLAAATLLIFPPFWHSNTHRGWRAARFVAVAILVGISFVIPVETHVRIDVPRSSP